MELDLRMLLSVSITALLMSVVFHFQARSFPMNIKGIRRWSWAFALFAVAMLLAATRSSVPLMISFWLAHLLLQCSLVLLYVGLAQFHERKVHLVWMVVPLALTSTTLGLLITIAAPLWMRVAVGSYGNFLVMLPIFILVLRGRAGQSRLRFTKLFTGLFFFLIMLVSLFRGSWAVVLKPIALPPAPFMVYQILTLVLPSLIVALSTGLAMMAFDRLKDELEYLVSHDGLTGVFSRRGFLELAQSEISRAVRTGSHTALLMLDLDHFKQVNDRYGHPAGDLVLCKFVDIAKTCLRREDFVGRFGGEEFMVLLPDTNPTAARVVAERIRTAISASRITLGKDNIRFTASIGVAIASGFDKGSLDELLKLADGAMYLAKSRGRNRVEVA